jgi:predicted lipid-binding transport protein (Tim44 family)
MAWENIKQGVSWLAKEIVGIVVCIGSIVLVIFGIKSKIDSDKEKEEFKRKQEAQAKKEAAEKAAREAREKKEAAEKAKYDATVKKLNEEQKDVKEKIEKEKGKKIEDFTPAELADAAREHGLESDEDLGR